MLTVKTAIVPYKGKNGKVMTTTSSGGLVKPL
jgi:hypothetical protein